MDKPDNPDKLQKLAYSCGRHGHEWPDVIRWIGEHAWETGYSADEVSPAGKIALDMTLHSQWRDGFVEHKRVLKAHAGDLRRCAHDRTANDAWGTCRECGCTSVDRSRQAAECKAHRDKQRQDKTRKPMESKHG